LSKQPLSHYSPKFANKAWSDADGYTTYFSCPYSNKIKKSSSGWKQWGRQRGLYTWPIEDSLNKDLETDAAIIYEKICSYNEIIYEERILWSQFLLSQLVRTPTYIRYETKARDIFGITEKPLHDRIGCKDCGDLTFIANRDWCLLLADEDDFFVRSDNPVLQTGFIELPETCLFYPLTPKLCFVACSMPPSWNGFINKPNETRGYKLAKGAAHLYNFHQAKTTGESLILSPKHDGAIAETMFKDVLGIYPQPPFSIHILDGNNTQAAFESIRQLMSATDGFNYPNWNPKELQPFYQK